MTRVDRILDSKGREVWVIGPDAWVFDALREMAEKNVGALVVMEEGRVVGVFSERDYARKVILEGKSSKETPVRDIMTTEVISVSPRESIEECMRLMTEHLTRHLPVLDGSRLVGLISIGDVVKAIISEQRTMIKDLEGYITGRR